MAILRVEDKNKLVSKVSLEPKRTYVSGSSGTTGEVYVFPNRSVTQKDNIDERLNLAPLVDGTSVDPDSDDGKQLRRDTLDELGDKIVKPFGGNSLEARRLEIFAGNLNKFDNQLIDAIQYQYEHEDVAGTLTSGMTTWADKFGSGTTDSNVFADTVNTYLATDPSRMGVGDKLHLVESGSGTNEVYGTVYTWSSNLYWEDADGNMYNKLPVSTRDSEALNYEPALALLLDGADPESEDHAWRQNAESKAQLYLEDPTTYSSYSAYSLGNSSLTGASPENYRFTGFVTAMVNGFPTQVGPINSKEQVNAWPPEIAKWGSTVVTNYAIQGYSDLSMHPRNKTKKLINFNRSSHEYFSKGSIRNRRLFQEFKKNMMYDEGYWTNNSHSLNLSTWTDGTTTYTPALVYPQTADREYEIEFSTTSVSLTMECWIKPDRLQTDCGTICQLHGNYALVLIPDTTTVVDGVAQNFKISLRVGSAANDGVTLSTSQAMDLANEIYVSNSFLTVDTWHHICFRWGRNFNNGQLVLYVDGVKRDSQEGMETGTRQGLIEASSTINTTNSSLFVGGWPEQASPTQRQVWEAYSGAQSSTVGPASSVGSTVSATTGLLNNFSVRYQLKSELTELRCWDYPRTEKELLKSINSRADTTTNMRFYIPFYFEPSKTVEIGVVKRPKLIPWHTLNEAGVTEDEDAIVKYYSGGTDTSPYGENGASVSQVNQPVNLTPYCSNWGHIAGVPFINVPQHAKEYKASRTPVVVGMPDMMKLNQAVYPNGNNESYDAIAEDRILYLIKHWTKIPWLRCWNSLMMPCTKDLGMVITPLIAVGTSKTGYFDWDPRRINCATTGSLEWNDPGQVKYMFDDEAWNVNEGLPIHKQVDRLDYTTSRLFDDGDIFDQDVITPFSPVVSIPIIYYGQSLLKENFSLKTTLPSGKDIEIVDLNNQLWIADKNGDPTVAKVGHISYQNGYMSIFSPLLSDITLEETTIEFRGSKDMHVLQFDVRCPPGVSNESNNVNFKSLKASGNANETDSTVTYISTVYLHDENLNVIGKVKLAQPIQKREEDSFLFRIKMDF